MATETFNVGIDEQDRLVIRIDTTRPVELVDLTKSFLSLAELYQSYATRLGLVSGDDELKLYLREIRSGSIIAEIVSLGPYIQQIAGVVQPLVQFTEQLKATYDYFRGAGGQEPAELSKRDLQRHGDVLQPTANDPGAQINVQVTNPQGDVVVNLPPYDSNESIAIRQRIDNYVAKRAEPESGRQEGQVFYWFQVRDDHTGRGDKGVIESISTRPVRVQFADEETKDAMLEGPILEEYFVVDVDVQIAEGKPRLYRILQVKDRFPKSEDEE